VFAREPVAGRVKTRLVPPLRSDEAADLAAACLADLTRRLGRIDARRVVALPPDASPEGVARCVPAGWEAADQGEGDLGQRLARATTRELHRGRAPVAVIGADHPDVPLAAVEGALAAAAAGRIGWITTADGGYACVALARPLPGFFAGIPWSTSGVAAASRAAAARLGIALVDTGPWYDLDTADDVDRFRGEPENARECPATWELLARLVPRWEERRR
jgi:rSAM/selenodomain-associated transferase 1